MKVVHVPYAFYPQPLWGTEVYVRDLCVELQKAGIDVLIAAPAVEAAQYRYQSLPVRRFAIAPQVSILDLYGEGDPFAAHSFGRLLDEERPQIIHLHSYTSASSLRLLRECRKRGLRVVLTYHSPTVTCQRGTLMRWGKEVCDGVVRESLCTRCYLHSSGLPRGVSDALGLLPPGLACLLHARGALRGPFLALGMRGLMRARRDAVRTLLREVDRVVVLSQWTRELLLRNGVPASKIAISRHGLGEEAFAAQLKAQDNKGKELRIAFFGRFHPVKGVDLLIRAVRGVPKEGIKLDLFGMTEGESPHGYESRIRRLAQGDPRIRLLPTVPEKEVVERLRGYDLLAVPSQWMETGPLVVLQAFAAGIPVLGSQLGGIQELVRDGVDGLLVQPRDVGAWTRTILQLSRDRLRLEDLRRGVAAPKRMEDVAKDMLPLYESLLPH